MKPRLVVVEYGSSQGAPIRAFLEKELPWPGGYADTEQVIQRAVLPQYRLGKGLHAEGQRIVRGTAALLFAEIVFPVERIGGGIGDYEMGIWSECSRAGLPTWLWVRWGGALAPAQFTQKGWGWFESCVVP